MRPGARAAIAIGAVGGTGSDLAVAGLGARFALVVPVPLALGPAVRARLPGLERAAGELQGLSALAVVVPVYAAMSGANDGAGLRAAVGGAPDRCDRRPLTESLRATADV